MEKNLQHATLHYVAHIVLAVLHTVLKFQESPIYHGHSPQMNRRKIGITLDRYDLFGNLHMYTCTLILLELIYPAFHYGL